MTDEWFELSIEVPRAYSDAVASFLFDCGTAGIEEVESDSGSCLTAYFPSDPPIDALRRLCSAAIESVSRHTIDSIRVRRVATADWARRWREGIEPLAVGERLWICPSWKAAPPPGRVVVVVDPGMAFGTGHHASTRGCLVSLEAAVRRSRVHRALDVGTGSGILAIALAKLGVTEVVAVDTDPLALAVASENFERNSVAAGVRPTSSLDEVEGPFDLVLANLFTNLLVNLAPRLTALLGSRGLLICSGFLADDGAAVEQAYAALGLARTAHYAEQGWVTLCLQKA